MMSTDDDNPTTKEDAGGRYAALLRALGASVDRLAALVGDLTPEQVRQQAYPTEWTVADVLSHLGSGAVITRKRFEGETDLDPQPIWDEWNAKSPDAQAAGALEADAALQARLAALTPDEVASLHFALGPMELDVPTFIGMRLNEHVVHTWDVEVTFDDAATIPPDEAALMVDTLTMISNFAGKPTGTERTLSVTTAAPEGSFEITLRPDGVALTPQPPVDGPDLELPGDALIRLVYGRLDPAHTPVIDAGSSELDELRRAFPGF
jgi:uncharacterized protein (TIGR03083 family)